MTENDLRHMERALDLAGLGHGHTSPNPLVGAVVVRDGEVLGEGYHAAYGEAHAEVAAIESCSVDPVGATLYVTLEPCCHSGKTLPCTDAILRAGIKRVVGRLRRPDREGIRPRPGHPARRGNRGGQHRRRHLARRPPAQPAVPQGGLHRAPAGDLQVGHEPRRQGRDADGRLAVDIERGEPPARAPMARRRWTRSASESERRSPTTRC